VSTGVNAKALRARLRSMGSTDTGVNSLLKELESYQHAQLRAFAKHSGRMNPNDICIFGGRSAPFILSAL
jgi:hypothetical protein